MMYRFDPRLQLCIALAGVSLNINQEELSQDNNGFGVFRFSPITNLELNISNQKSRTKISNEKSHYLWELLYSLSFKHNLRLPYIVSCKTRDIN